MLLGALGAAFASSAGTSLMNGGGFADALKGFSGNLIDSFGSMMPALFSSNDFDVPVIPKLRESKLGEKMMALNRQREALRLSIKQAEAIKEARQKISSQQAFFSNRGFSRGGSTSQILQNDSFENLRNQLRQEAMLSNMNVLDSEVRQLESNYSSLSNLEAMNFKYESPLERGLKNNFIEPMKRESLRSLGRTLSSGLKGFFNGKK